MNIDLTFQDKPVYGLNDTGAVIEAPASSESEFLLALRSAAAEADSGSAVKSDEDEEVALERNRQWQRIHENLVLARTEVERSIDVVAMLQEKKLLGMATEDVEGRGEPLESQARRIVAQRKIAQLSAAAGKLYARTGALQEQVDRDRVFFADVRALCRVWRLECAEPSKQQLLFDYVPQLTLARDAASLHERALCVRDSTTGRCRLHLPQHRLLAIPLRLNVYLGEALILSLEKAKQTPPAPPATTPDVTECHSILTKARQSVWLQRIFEQLVGEAAVAPIHVAWLGEHEANATESSVGSSVCVSLDDASQSVLTIKMEKAADGANGDDHNNSSSGSMPVDDDSSTASTSRRKRTHAEITPTTTARETDTGVVGEMALDLQRVLQRVAEQSTRQSIAHARRVSFQPPAAPNTDTSCAGTERRRSMLAGCFAAQQDDERCLTESPVGLLRAIRVLYRHHSAIAAVQLGLDAAKAVVPELTMRWTHSHVPTHSTCAVSLGNDVLGDFVVVDGAVKEAFQRAPAILSPANAVPWALRLEYDRLLASMRVRNDNDASIALDRMLLSIIG